MVLPQPLFEDFDSWDEVVTLSHQQVDVVEVLAAAETVGKIVAWIDGCAHFFAARTEKAKIAFAPFRDWTVAAESDNG